MKADRIKSFDAIRGIACLIVLFAHILASDEKYGMYANGCGKIGVWCFMVLSGFLSFLPYLNSESDQCISVKFLFTYYKKKMGKIYPSYIFALFFAYLFGFISVKEILLHMIGIEGTMHFWYMPVIMKFYLVFPIIVILYYGLERYRNRIISVLLICVGILFAYIFPFIEYTENSIMLKWYLPVLIIGILLSIIYNKMKCRITESVCYDIVIVMIIVVILLMTPCFRQLLFRIEPSGWLQNKYLLIGVLWALLLLAVNFSKYIRCFLEKCKVLSFIGRISYELYLIHYLILQYLKFRIGNTLLRGLITVILSILISILINYGIGYVKNIFKNRHALEPEMAVTKEKKC